jgi:hypothetical protein
VKPDLLEEFQLFGDHVAHRHRAGDVAARPRQAFDVAGGHRIEGVDHDDRDLGCRRSRRAHALILEGDDQVDPCGNPLPRRRLGLRLVRLVAPVEAQVLAILIAHLVQRLMERGQGRRLVIQPDVAKSDPRGLGLFCGVNDRGAEQQRTENRDEGDIAAR